MRPTLTVHLVGLRRGLAVVLDWPKLVEDESSSLLPTLATRMLGPRRSLELTVTQPGDDLVL